MDQNLKLGLGVALAALILDQATKWLILVVAAMEPHEVIPITGFFNLVLTWNRGISFGLFNNDSGFNAWVLSIIALIIVGVLLNWLRKAENKKVAVSIGLIIGGALGNVIDRVLHVGVVDFLDVHISGYHWPAFNGADSFITVGAIMLVVDSLFSRSDDKNTMDET